MIRRKRGPTVSHDWTPGRRPTAYGRRWLPDRRRSLRVARNSPEVGTCTKCRQPQPKWLPQKGISDSITFSKSRAVSEELTGASAAIAPGKSIRGPVAVPVRTLLTTNSTVERESEQGSGAASGRLRPLAKGEPCCAAGIESGDLGRSRPYSFASTVASDGAPVVTQSVPGAPIWACCSVRVVRSVGKRDQLANPLR